MLRDWMLATLDAAATNRVFRRKLPSSRRILVKSGLLLQVQEVRNHARVASNAPTAILHPKSAARQREHLAGHRTGASGLDDLDHDTPELNGRAVLQHDAPSIRLQSHNGARVNQH
jgi:hypothetical protein